MSNKKWWELRSAADDGDDLDDDGPEVVEQDDDGDWIDNFRFSDYRADRGLSSSDAIWNRYGYAGSTFGSLDKSWRSSGLGSVIKQFGTDVKTAKRLEAAQRLVQGFVDTFALDNPLKAHFSAHTVSLGGEEGEKSVVVSHRPLLDKSLSEPEAHRVMTAQAANAAAHARYGGRESLDRQMEISSRFPNNDLASQLGALLDDYRIDSSFRRDYPGYEDVYAPAQEYVAKGLLGDRERFALEDFKGASIANAALNYAPFTDWSERESEREWWTDWANEYAFSDPAEFGDGVDAAINHLNIPLPPKPPTSSQPDAAKDDDKSDDSSEDESQGGGKSESEQDSDDQEQGGSGAGDEGEDESQDDQDSGEQESEGDQKGDGDQESEGESEGDQEQGGSGSDSGSSESLRDEDEDPQELDEDPQELDEDDAQDSDGGGAQAHVDLPVGLGNGVSLTGLANGQSTDVDADTAERVAASAGALVTGRDDNEVGEVYWSAKGFTYNGRLHVEAKSSANGYIRRAFTRSRTAHYAVERGHLTGRIDNRSLPRIASDDYRLFSKRVAPSETKYRVWLMLDNSGSMRGNPSIQAMNLAASLALAVRHVPNVTLDVWAWTSGIKTPSAQFSAVRVYADGEPIAKIGDVGQCPQGGTPDGQVLSWASREIRKQCRPDETPVILMASDGDGSLASESWQRNFSVDGYPAEEIARIRASAGKDRVAVARQSGVKVMSVAIGNGINAATQEAIYGKGNYLPWEGSIQKMAKPLGDLLARVASNHA
jgi:hypothetical protein